MAAPLREPAGRGEPGRRRAVNATPGYRTLAGQWRGRTLNASEPPRQQNGRVHVQGHDQAGAEPDAEPVRQGLRGKRLETEQVQAVVVKAVLGGPPQQPAADADVQTGPARADGPVAASTWK